MNYNIKIDLTKMRGVAVRDGKIIIPIDGSVVEQANGSVFLNIVAFELFRKEFGQTHLVKVKWPEETIKNMTEQEYRRLPFIGNMKGWRSK